MGRPSSERPREMVRRPMLPQKTAMNPPFRGQMPPMRGNGDPRFPPRRMSFLEGNQRVFRLLKALDFLREYP